MSVNLKDLKASQDEANRKIRDFVSTPQGVIEVYEPTMSDIVDIIQIQRSENENEDELAEEVEFEDLTVIKVLFPLLTNLDFSELPDEEIQEIIENPSIHLLTVQQIIAQIIQEANKYYAQKVKTEIINAESTMAQVDLINTIPSIVLSRSKLEGTSNELTDNVAEAERKLQEAIEKEKVVKDQIDEVVNAEKDGNATKEELPQRQELVSDEGEVDAELDIEE